MPTAKRLPVTQLRIRPTCGHRNLMECPLTKEDWEDVYTAMQAFRYQCAVIAERAHKRAEAGG